MRFPSLRLALPPWVEDYTGNAARRFAGVEERVRLTVGLARENAARGTGGPFGAGVFRARDGKLIAAGVNLVVPCGCSSAHAEIVALSLAQRVMGSHDLGADGLPDLELVSSAEPCAMCLGAIPWSGVRGLVCAARDEDARAIGMDEGDKPADWPRRLEQRGIRVVRDVCREESARVLRAYRDAGGFIYNGRSAP